MVLAIPGGRGLFSILQTGFRYSDRSRIRLDKAMRAQLDDFETLAHEVISRPTRLGEIVPDALSAIGACDASGHGMGGVAFAPNHPPLVWRAMFPSGIQHQLISGSNPTGDLTNSDFELVSVLAQQDVMAQHFDLREKTASILNDNTPAVSRAMRGSVTSTSAVAYLLRLGSLHQRHHRYLITYDHIPGVANAMADDASRLFHLSDTAFLAHFEQHYPQTLPWHLCHLRSEMHSSLICGLRSERPEPALFLNVPPHVTHPGPSGPPSAVTITWTPSSKMSLIPSSSSWSLQSGIAMAASPKMASLFGLDQWRTSYAPSARRWPAWGPKTYDWLGPVSSTTAWANN
jgi:hypothetical protein